MLSGSTGGSQNRTTEINVEEIISSQNVFIYCFSNLTHHVGHLASYIHKTVPIFRNSLPASCKSVVSSKYLNIRKHSKKWNYADWCKKETKTWTFKLQIV